MASTQAVVPLNYRELPEESNNGKDYSKQEKQNKRHRKKLLCQLLLEFSENTTLHGPKYIAERQLSVLERMFWIVTSVTSLCVCVFLIWQVWVKWQTSPVIVTLSEQLSSVTEVPFPAVTICPHAKIRQEVYNYTKHKIDLTIFAREVLYELPLKAQDEALDTFMKNNPLVEELLGIELICSFYREFVSLSTVFINNTAVQSIQKIAPQLHDVFLYGTWRNKKMNATGNYLHPVLTKEGVCFTFNNLHDEEIFHVNRIQSEYKYMEAHFRQKLWTLENGYLDSSDKAYPFRGKGNGAEPDLTLYLKEILDRDMLCDGANRGFKVYLHHPADFPQSSLYYYSVPPDQFASFAIKVNVMETSPTLANYPPHIRQCYFPGEKDLQYFKVYTPNNCRLECLTNYTLNLCDCVWFYMPHNDQVKICSTDSPCMRSGLDHYTFEINNSNMSACNCMPLCNSIKYEAEVVKTSYNANAYKSVINNVIAITNITAGNKYFSMETRRKYAHRYDYTKSNVKIEMYFKEPYFMSMRRSELFGLTDFLANCGGLLGLFLGFSFLSIVEIFYFFTLRLACTFRRDNLTEKNSKENEIRNKAEKN